MSDNVAFTIQKHIADFKGPYKRRREVAVEVLGKIGAPAVEPLCEALQDENWVVRRYVALALGWVGDKRAIPALYRAMEDPDPEVGRCASVALARTSV